MIFQLDTISDILNYCLQDKKQKNEAYSLRALARDLQMSASHLSQVMAGKKNLSADHFLPLQSMLTLNEDEKTYLKLLFDEQRIKEKKFVFKIQDQLRTLRARYNVDVRDADTFKVISDWYHVAILELACKGPGGLKLEQIQDSLCLGQDQVNQAVRRLLRLGLVKESRGKIKRTKSNLAFRCDQVNVAFAKYHLQMCKLAELAIVELPVRERVVSSQTFTMNSNLLPEARAAVREFIQKMTDLYEKDSNRDSLYNLNVNFFPMDERILDHDSTGKQ